MLSTLFLKKIFYFFTTGTLLFYIVSFETSGHAADEEKVRLEMIQCQENVRAMNAGRIFTLKERFQITFKNIVRLNLAEQKAVSSYLKEMKSSLVKQGTSNPLKVSTYKFHSATNQLLGFKVVVQDWESSMDEVTYFLDQDAQILFKHVDRFVPEKTWTCEKNS
ncbi:MAG: hypothetical protein JNL11_12660 [Bdellovibrionaceae bacterium]|nr:hypothetical protein [Pseudobdellovibrionaceae bacterium]